MINSFLPKYNIVNSFLPTPSNSHLFYTRLNSAAERQNLFTNILSKKKVFNIKCVIIYNCVYLLAIRLLLKLR